MPYVTSVERIGMEKEAVKFLSRLEEQQPTFNISDISPVYPGQEKNG
jgi:hypothetical protein